MTRCFVFRLYFLEVLFILDTQLSSMFRTLEHSLPHKWRRAAQPKVALRRYRNYFYLVSYICVFLHLLANCLFSRACFLPTHNLSCLRGFVCLALNTFRRRFGRAKYYTRPSSANPHWLTVTLRPLCPAIARSEIQEIDFSKRKLPLPTLGSNWYE